MLSLMKDNLPFLMKSLVFDNGIEYVNHLLVQEFKNVQRVDEARGRSGKSNDQFHIEQKNNAFVRSVFGHVRIEDPSLIPMMNEIYEVYDKPKTPFQRLMECHTYPEEQKEKLPAPEKTEHTNSMMPIMKE